MTAPHNSAAILTLASESEQNLQYSRERNTYVSKRSYLILGVAILGVLGIAGTAVGVSYKNTEESTGHVVFNKKTIEHNDEDVCVTKECMEAAEEFLENLGNNTDPCDDFYTYACGGYIANHPVNLTSENRFNEINEANRKRIQHIFQSGPREKDLQPVLDMHKHFKNCLDTDKLESMGLKDMTNKLQEYGGWPLTLKEWDEDSFDLEVSLANVLIFEDVRPLIQIDVQNDFKNTTNKILYVQEGKLGTFSLFLQQPDIYKKYINKYKDYISSVAKEIRSSLKEEVNDKTLRQDVNDLVDFEIKIAQLMDSRQMTKTEVVSKSAMVAKIDVSKLQHRTDKIAKGQIDWLKFFHAMFSRTVIKITKDEPLYIFDNDFFTDLSTILSITPKKTIANYIAWLWVKKMSPETTSAMRDIYRKYQSFDTDIDVNELRERECQTQTEAFFDFPLTRTYVEQFFRTEDRKQIKILVELIREAFKQKLDQNKWMAQEDVKVAQEKLEAIKDYVAYPEWIFLDNIFVSFYQKLKIYPGDHFNNLINIYEFYNTWNLAAFRITASKVFVMAPTEVNAFYQPTSNIIAILLGILQTPFYRKNTTPALVFSGLGQIIGHELTHGFDNSGSHFDKDGNLADWWSEATNKAFQEKTKCFVDQYDGYYPPELDGIHVDGQLTLGENIADNGGIREAFTAYKTFLKEYGGAKRLPGLENFTSEQLFFLSLANIWCENPEEEELKEKIRGNPHSPGRFRIIGMFSNNQDFAEAFQCKVGTKMNRGSESCIIW